MTAVQFWEWMAFAQLEPFNEERMDYRFGSVVRALYSVFSSKGTTIPDVERLSLRFGDSPAPRQTWEDMMRITQELTYESQIDGNA
jgi:hypothetical protein